MADQRRKPKAQRKQKATRKPSTRKKKATRKKRPKVDPMQDRAGQMQQLREDGYTFGAIADEFGVSRQRVHQLVSGARAPKEVPERDPKEPPSELLRGRGIQRKMEQFKNRETVGDRIVYRRMKCGWTIGQLAQESGIPYGVLSTYENDKAQPSCDSIRKLCKALEMSAHWLIFGSGFNTWKQNQEEA